MDNIKSVFLASVLAGLLLLAALPASAGLVGWQYQQGVTIHENSGETLRDYQVLVELEGSDFPREAQPYGDDIRFTDADGRELSCWIEEFDAGSKRAKIWVKVSEIPANGEAEITIWYGNPGAESRNDGDAVFEFFDDFKGTSLDTTKWNSLHTVDAGTSVSVHDGLLDFDVKSGYAHTGGCIISKITLPTTDFVSETKVKFTNYYGSALGAYAGFTNAISYDDAYYGDPTQKVSAVLWDYTNKGRYLHLKADDIGDDTGTTSISIRNMWFKMKTIYTPPTNVKGIWIQLESPFDERTLEKSGHGGIDPTYIAVGVGDYNTNEHTYFDYVFIRKFTSAEPTIIFEEPKSSALYIKKSATPYSIRQFQDSTITISIENSGTFDITDIEVMDSIHPSLNLISGDFPNPKRYDLIRLGETREIQYTISAKESGTFTLDPATVTYEDGDGNIQEAKSEPASIKVIPSTEGGTSGTSYNPSISSASVQLHGEKTDVVLGEDILFKLSAVNLITKPTMHVQVIIIPPSGMSVTSSAFTKSGAGQYTTTYELEPGSGKDIEVAIRSNQVGDFNVNGRIIYYFGDDREHAEDHTLNLPIKVRAEPGAEQTEAPSESDGLSTPGFVAVFAVIGLLAVYTRKRI